MSDLSAKNCATGAPALLAGALPGMLKQVPGWEVKPGTQVLEQLFKFDSYWAGVIFANGVAWIAQKQNHHPDMEITYKKVRVSYTTHDAGGLTENDFICAARINSLLK